MGGVPAGAPFASGQKLRDGIGRPDIQVHYSDSAKAAAFT